MVADVNFTAADPRHGSGARNQNERTDEWHRRDGLANAMYVLAEVIFGKPLVSYWGGDPFQSPAAAALSARPNRPFRNPHSPHRRPPT